MKITERKLRKIIKETINEISNPSSSGGDYSTDSIDFINRYTKWIKVDDETYEGEEVGPDDHPYMADFDDKAPGSPTENAFRKDVQVLIDAACEKKTSGTSDLAFLLLRLLDNSAYGNQQSYQFLYTVIMALKMSDGKNM